MSKISVNIFFPFLSSHYGFTNCPEILNSVFSNIIPGRVSICKIVTSQDQYFQKYKAQKIVKFSFLAFQADFFKNFVLKTYGTFKMFLLRACNNFHIILSPYVEGHMQKNSSLNFKSLIGFQASRIWMFFQKKICVSILEITFRQKQFFRAPCFLIF